jgi:hypothetical protein
MEQDLADHISSSPRQTQNIRPMSGISKPNKTLPTLSEPSSAHLPLL